MTTSRLDRFGEPLDPDDEDDGLSTAHSVADPPAVSEPLRCSFGRPIAADLTCCPRHDPARLRPDPHQPSYWAARQRLKEKNHALTAPESS